jgi:hypothetical protein
MQVNRMKKKAPSHSCRNKTAWTLSNRTSHIDQLLDEALNETFPASDPIAINIECATDQRADTPGRESLDPLASGYNED